MAAKVKCAHCRYKTPKGVCGSEISPFHNEQVELNHSCELFQPIYSFSDTRMKSAREYRDVFLGLSATIFVIGLIIGAIGACFFDLLKDPNKSWWTFGPICSVLFGGVFFLIGLVDHIDVLYRERKIRQTGQKEAHMDEGEIKQTIMQILQPLQRKIDRSRTVALLGLLVAVGLAILTYPLGGGLGLASAIIGMSVLGILVVVIAISELAEDRAHKSYSKAFPPNSTERSLADRILSSLDEPKLAADAFRKKLVKSAEETRRAEQAKEEAEAALRRMQRARDTWTITDTFKCASCDSCIDWRPGGKNNICPECKATLCLPADMACPSCGGTSIGIMSRPRGTGTGKLAGALMYGPAGLLAGSVLDSVKDGLEKQVRQKIRNPVLCCESCKTYWGIRVPARTQGQEYDR